MKKIADDYNLPNLIKENIIRKIIQGELKPGDKLTETEYAKEFGTSRAPVREAFTLLLLDSFVQKFPRKGTVVKGYTLDEIRDLLDIRNFLEQLSLQKISVKNLPSYLNKMNQLIVEMEQKQDQSKEYANLNYEFHNQIILASESNVIKNAYNRLGTPLLSIQTMSFMETQNIKKSLKEHDQIVQYIEERNIEEARKLLDSHNKDVFPRIERFFPK